MLTDRHFPYSSMQEINLDWILTKVKNLMRFLPDDGAVGQILRRTAHGAEWSDEQGGGGGAVSSVNGQTGAVVLTASDVGALPDTYVAPVTSVNGQTGDVIVSGGAVDSVNGQTGTVVLDKSDIGLGNVANVLQYSSSNPPPYPVTSVNSQTGAVSLSIPTDTGDLTNGAGYVTAAGAAAAAPVQSVNGQTGAVTLAIPVTQTYTPVVTKSSGVSSYNTGSCIRWGNVVSLSLTFDTGGAANNGANIFIGTISGVPLPIGSSIGVGYKQTCVLMSEIKDVASIYVRVLAANKPSGTDTYSLSWVYVTND